MVNSIKEDLNTLFSNGLGSFDKYKVIFALTRIRKVLDAEKTNATYPFLRLYCDWAVHNEIDREKTLRVISVLNIFKDDLDIDEVEFMGHVQFLRELYKFVKTVLGIELSIGSPSDSREHFVALLDDIYVDVPLIINYPRKKIATLKIKDSVRYWHTVEE